MIILPFYVGILMVIALSGITFKCVKHSFKICLQTLFSKKKQLFNFCNEIENLLKVVL